MTRYTLTFVVCVTISPGSLMAEAYFVTATNVALTLQDSSVTVRFGVQCDEAFLDSFQVHTPYLIDSIRNHYAPGYVQFWRGGHDRP